MKSLSYSAAKYLNGGKSEFKKPEDYSLHLPILKICKVCKKVSFTRRISVFDNNCIFVCSHCGARHSITYKRIMSKTLFTIILFLCVLFAVIRIASAVADFDSSSVPSSEKTTTAVSAEEKEYKKISSSGITLTPNDTLYLSDHSFEAKRVNPNSEDKWYPSSYYYDESNGILWLEFSAVQGSESFSAWYPYYMSNSN